MSSDQIRKLANQPLTAVLAEIKFSEVLKIADKIPDLQEELRHEYPLISESVSRHVSVYNREVTVKETPQWCLSAKDRSSALLISTNRIVFMTANYNRFTGFQDELVRIVGVLSEIVKPTLLLRIGLRYNDAVHEGNGLQFEGIVNPQFLPDPAATMLGNEVSGHSTELAILTDIGTLVVRSMFTKGDMTVMPDLHDSLLIKIPARERSGENTLLLDFDHFWNAGESGEDFVVKVVDEKLNALHHVARQAFFDITTEEARKRLWE